MPVQLILVRHGQPDVPKVGPTGNPPLSARGHEQARHVADVLKSERIDRIFSSGMMRADSTAKPLVDALGIAVEVHPHLGEVDRYGGEYASIEAIRDKGHEEWRRFLASPLSYFGVDPDRFRSETLGAFREVMTEAIDQSIVIFTHGFPINILLSHALGLNDDARFVPSYASITRVTGRSFDALTVVSVNESGHIPEALK
jgi:broad specificity phosphatase PhoE